MFRLNRSIPLLLILLQWTDSAKILVITPNLANSMVLYAGRIADVLQSAGHDVTMLIPVMRSTNKMNGTKLAKVIRIENLGDHFDKVMDGYADTFQPYKESIWNRRNEMITMSRTCEAVLKRFKEIEYLKDQKFDLAITDHTDFCDIGLFHALGIKHHIWTTTGPILDINSWAMGIPTETSYVPVPWESDSGPAMSLLERAWNLIHSYMDRIMAYEQVLRINRLFRRYVDPNFKDVWEIAAQSSLLFVNADEFIEPVRSVPPNVIYIGGVGMESTNLDDLKVCDINKFPFLSPNSTQRLVYFSLGSSASTLQIRAETKRQILQAFAHFKNYQFILKVDREDEEFKQIGAQFQNVRVVDWAPQHALLAHPQMRLFVTHAGYNSILESTISGVPMLLLPLFFDQHRNARSMEYRQVGRVLYPHLITEETLKRELEILLNNHSYLHTARRLSRLHRQKPNKPNETLLKWVDFALQNGPLNELKPHVLNLNWFQQANFDVYCLLLAGLFVFWALLTRSLQFVAFVWKVFVDVERKVKVH
ncbi:UDP-glucuronosyltransferase [Aphelenchoides bicaudatus]|nr:UDP-glucuronosyltransferase [Aphelenchoides bicaudatus]